MDHLPWTPWHKVVNLRPDLKSGELSLATFAADLYDVASRRGQRPVYENPAEFFALTYPTYNLRELAREVMLRLAGQNDKAVRQLALTYGGGKTHTLITLYHLANDPDRLPRHLPAVQEFISEIGIPLPRARIAALTFDKLDVEKGMEVRGPNGELRWLKQPWSVLAFQIAGPAGLRLLHADNLEAERESAPAENLLADLLALPQKEGLGVLILLDEVLMYAREKIGLEPAWRDRLVNFFQYLTQAVTRTDRACLVASLLATDPHKSDTLGKQITQELEAIFARQREESIQPVQKDDVAEVLRRRMFTPDSIRDREAFRPHVVAALKGIEDLEPQKIRQEGKSAEDRFLRSYPFHPDLTEVLYSKWTNLEGFQRTRGVLRTFALALREAEQWDPSPLISTNVFLKPAGQASLGEAARELAQIATAEEYEGKTMQWSIILESELKKAIEIQEEFSGLHGREVEQAVMAAFLHSQPINQRMHTSELFLLVGHTRPDKIELEKALLRWASVSWYLDDTLTQEKDANGSLPKHWRLGSRPNLTQIHSDATRFRVSEEMVENVLIQEIGKLKSLTSGASAQGVRVHNLPKWPREIEDDGAFHFAILDPKAASAPGAPSSEACRFINETTAPDRPRVYRNALVLCAPSLDGLDAAREAIRDYLGWEDVKAQLQNQALDPVREGTLLAKLQAARQDMPEAIRQAYNVGITVDKNNRIQALKITPTGEPLFTVIKNDQAFRIQETAVRSDALLPGGPYNLWREGDESRRLKDLVTAFAQFPHLPKMLNTQAILDTLVAGCEAGQFVLRLPRPDRTFRTFWHQHPDELALQDPALEVVLPEKAVLSELAPELLKPNTLPGLWPAQEICVQQVLDYFSGSHVAQVAFEGYEEPMPIPAAAAETVRQAIEQAVQRGLLWLVADRASVYMEPMPEGLLMPEAQLLPPPARLAMFDVLPERIPQAWQREVTSALAIAAALSSQMGRPAPWKIVQAALDSALNHGYLERTVDSGNWPCDYSGAQFVKVRLVREKPPLPPTPPTPPPPPPSGKRTAEAYMQADQIQDLAEEIGELLKNGSAHGLKFHLRVELDESASPEVVAQVNEILAKVNEKLHLK